MGHTAHTCAKSLAPKCCTSCNELLPRTEFRVRKATAYSICKSCERKKETAIYETLNGRAKSILNAIRHTGRPMDSHFSVEYIVELYHSQNGKCAYTGLPMSVKRGPHAFSVDRVDNNLDYLVGNVVLCLWAVNQMKNQHPLSFFKQICAAVTKHSEQPDASEFGY